MKRSILPAALVAFVVALVTVVGFNRIQQNRAPQRIQVEHVDAAPTSKILYTKDNDGQIVPLDFTGTAAAVKDAVVHIRSTQTRAPRGQRQYPNQPDMNDMFERFFGPLPDNMRPQEPNRRAPNGDQPFRMGTGSGVIISPDGYIVTNNHVIDQADDLEVTLNDNRTYKAELIGTAPKFDLALLKVEETGLPVIPFANSDAVQVGEWVLAIGNPFDLNSTVTAGIVSAKGRNIRILEGQTAVESFIQTDAAINPGNSGGALVDLRGGLVGINTAIASRTGSYAGYGFAVPAALVEKIVQDLIEYGAVQRGFLGAQIVGVNANVAREYGLERNSGVYVAELTEGSSAAEAGVEQGDVIIAIDGAEVRTNPQLLERISRKRPGDVVQLTVDRNGRERTFDVTLLNQSGSTELAAVAAGNYNPTLGAELVETDAGVQVKSLRANGKLRRATNMEEGFVITDIDRRPVRDLRDLEAALNDAKGGVLLSGKYPDSDRTEYFAFGI